MASWKRASLWACAALVALSALPAAAQDYPMHRGGVDRLGKPGLAPSTPSGTPPATYNNIGRGFLRWWDPISTLRRRVDNIVGTPNPAGEWFAPPLGAAEIAFNFIQGGVGADPYMMTRTVSALSSSQPTVGAGATARAFTFRFDGLNVGSEFRAFLNIPIGPTDLDPAAGRQSLFPQQYYVVEVTGVEGGPFVDVIDTFALGGGMARIGVADDGTPRIYTVAAGGAIDINLYNTTPRRPDGGFLDPFASPGNELVYADLAELQTVGGASGTYTASPVITELTATPPVGGSPFLPRRVLAARNEPTTAGSLNRQYELGVASSYAHDGSLIDLADPVGRRNLVFSWPVRRPLNTSTAETQRYASDKEDWITGVGGVSRADHRILLDNTSGGVTTSGVAFEPRSVFTSVVGPNYLRADISSAPSGAPDSEVRFQPNLPVGNYLIDFWLPGSSGSNLTTEAEVRIVQGGTTARTLRLDQSAGNGWVRLSGPAGGFVHTSAAPLRVIVSNRRYKDADAGTTVYADAVRFTKQADLRITSTPVQVRTTVTLPGGATADRDVAVIAMENGRLACIDAHGDAGTGLTSTVYWTYPTETSGTDPNQTVAEDGEDLIAEMPAGFDLTSALVANVGGQDLLFIGSSNGRVYAIEMAGRGDGSTRRRWTFPDDYDPSDPASQRLASTLGPIVGSVTYAEPGGNPTVFVPTSQGRLFALDASGNPASKSTTVRWQYPAATDTPLGPIRMTPLAQGNLVYFGAPNALGSSGGTLYALDQATGAVVWSVDSHAGESFGPFDVASPVYTSAAETGTGLDALWMAVPADLSVDASPRLISFNPATGDVLNSTSELLSSPTASPVFTYVTTLDNNGLPQTNQPTIMVPSQGRLAGFSADGVLDDGGSRRVWGYSVAGSPLIASPALGGKRPLEAFSWMVIGDSAGFLYAFNHDPSRADNDQAITPGDQPGGQIVDDNDRTAIDLNTILRNARFALLAPATYFRLIDELREGTLDYSDITAAIAEGSVTRGAFEFGETLHVVVYDLPRTQGSVTDYTVKFQIVGPNRAAGERPFAPEEIPGTKPSGREMVMLTAFPLFAGGSNGTPPGQNQITWAIRAGSGNQGIETEARVQDFALANPLAIGPIHAGWTGSDADWLGNTLDPANVEVVGNGNPGGDTQVPVGGYGPDYNAAGALVGHGQTAVGRLLVRDRSLMAVLYGSGRGLSNVVLDLGRLAWVKDTSASGGVYKAFDPAFYPNFEDLPLQVPNVSLDYPDIDRANLSVRKDGFGFAENPQVSSVTLNAPRYSDANYEAYRELTGYNAGLTRELVDTRFELGADVPRFQPPSADGYRNRNAIRVASSDPVRPSLATEPYRLFDMSLGVAVDSRITVATPTVDLGSIPGGGGYNGAPGGLPRAPWASDSLFRPWNPDFTQGDGAMFQPFSVFNEGNVNMLNVRVAKGYRDPSSLDPLGSPRPLELFGSAQHQLAWLDGRLHLHSDLDPTWSSTFRAGTDALGRNIVAKPRPGDLVASRLSTNPLRRANATLDVTSSYLLDQNGFPPGDPMVGVSTPIGAATGDYAQQIFVFEDLVMSDPPELRWDEPFADPSFQLRFRVRESRLTNRPTTKSAPMVEQVIAGNEPFRWSNQQPAGLRDSFGNLFVAWSSNRLGSGDQPDFDPRGRTENDTLIPDQWRVYIGGLRRDPSVVVPASPLADLDQFVPSSANRWFNQAVAVPLPTGPFDSLFPLRAGDQLAPATIRFGNPVFPSGGVYDTLEFPSNTGRTGYQTRYLAMTGEASRVAADGSVDDLSVLLLQGLQLNGDATVGLSGGTAVLPANPTARKSRPGLVQLGSNAVVFFTSAASGGPELNWASYNPAGGWTGVQSLALGDAFESLGAPSPTLRRYRNLDSARYEVAFTGRLRGRTFAESFLGRMVGEAGGVPSAGTGFLPFGNRLDEAFYDATSGVFWTPGVLWQMDGEAATVVDVRMVRAGGAVSVLKSGTGYVDRGTGLVSFDTTLGGQVFLDSRTGSVRFAGGVIPRDARVFVTYNPSLLRVSSGPGANYRAASMVFDDRFLGVYVDPNNPRRNLVGDLAYWFSASGATVSPTSPIRWDRQIVSATRTSGTGDAASRPFMRTLRLGVVLPTPVATDANGNIALTVSFGTSPAAGEAYYQVDPASGVVFFMAGAEDLPVRITYTGVDAQGAVLPGLVVDSTVGWVAETQDSAMPIEQVGNESGLTLALDPLGSGFNSVGNPRPQLVWAFWTSTRAGSPDVYFQTLAPRLGARRPGE